MLEQADEVQEALGRNYNTPEIDDDELAAELDALGDEIALDDDTSYLDDVMKAPEAPSEKPEASGIKTKVFSTYCCKHFLQLIYLLFRMVFKLMSLVCLKFQVKLNEMSADAACFIFCIITVFFFN